MVRARFILALLFVACFSLATSLQLHQERENREKERSTDVLALMLGDGRKMFANQIFAKADAYFHRGNYPSIFDLNARKEEGHMMGESEHDDHNEHSEGEHHDEEAP